MLLDLQRHFRAAVSTAEDGALASLVATPMGSTANRIDVYRNNVQASLGEVLAIAFPVTHRIVGAGMFAEIARRFIAASPPAAPQLSVYGAGFPAFIAASSIAERLPYLPDVACVEWARGEAYFAADAAPLSPAALQSAAVADLLSLRLGLHQATRLVRSAFPIAQIWRINQPEIADVPAVDMTIAENVLVTRPAMHLLQREIGAGDAAFVGAIAAGSTLAQAAESALAADPDFNLQVCLQQHLVYGTFADDRARA